MALGPLVIEFEFESTRARDCVRGWERQRRARCTLTCMAATPATKNSVHWAPSPIPSPLSDSSSSSSFTSSSTIQYINAQLISHGFAIPPGLSLDGLSTADAENVTKCMLSMLSQRVVSVFCFSFTALSNPSLSRRT